MKKQLLVILLFVCLVFAMIACTDNQSPSGTDDSGTISGTELSGTLDPPPSEPSGSIEPTPSEPSKPSDTIEPSDHSGTIPPSEPSGGEEEPVTPIEPEQSVKYAIRLYKTEDVDDYTVLEYEEGEIVDVSEWPVPSGIKFEGETIPFVHWLDEQQENVVSEDFSMPSRSMAFYATYDYPQLFRWSYDADAQTYTSTGAGIRPAKGIEGGYSGTLSAELTVNNASSTGIGIIWNLTCGDNDYPYADGCSYWYFHLNPSNGAFQLAYVQEDGTYIAIKTVSLSDSPQSWQDKYAEYKNSSDEALSTVFSVEYNTSEISLYVDREELYTYTGDMLGGILGKGVGIRTNVADNVAKNITYTPDVAASNTYIVTYVNTAENTEEVKLVSTDNFVLPSPSVTGYEFLGWYEDEEFTSQQITEEFVICADVTFYGKFVPIQTKNGYNIYSDGRYESTVAKATVTVDGAGSRYGKWSTDITVTDRNNIRTGILINSYVPSSESTVPYDNTSVSGIYVHHNVNANVNFTLTTIHEGVYESHPDGTKEALKVSKYDSSSEGALGAYYAKNRAFVNGETDSLTFNLAVEVLNTYIKVYLDGECIIEYTAESGLEMFNDYDDCLGVGFTTASVGTTFSDYSYTEMEAQEKPTTKNGFIISADGSSYTSDAATVATIVDGISGRYGKWSVDITETNRTNARIGILINAYVKSDDGQVKYTDQSVCGYYLHHSIKSNTNFTLSTIYRGTYQQQPDGTKMNLLVCKYNAESSGALKDYHARCKAFLAKETDSLTFNLGIEVMPEYIKAYLDGECIIEYTTAAGLGLFDNVDGCIGVGFNTQTIGTVFSNMSFVPYIAED